MKEVWAEQVMCPIVQMLSEFKYKSTSKTSSLNLNFKRVVSSKFTVNPTEYHEEYFIGKVIILLPRGVYFLVENPRYERLKNKHHALNCKVMTKKSVHEMKPID